MLRIRSIAYAASIALALYGAQAGAQPTLPAPEELRPKTGNPPPDSAVTPTVEYGLGLRLKELQEKVQNSYCVTPELQKQLAELRRDLDKATMRLDMQKPVDRYKLGEHERLSRELSDLGEGMQKLPRACPRTEKISAVEQPSQADDRFPPPTTPLGGKQPAAGCTDKERTDERLRLQEEVLKLEGELIRTDGTTPTGRARQTELQREIKHAADDMDRLRERCPYEIGFNRTKLPDLTKDLGQPNEFVDVGDTPNQKDRPTQPQLARDDCQAAEGIHACTTEEDKTAQAKAVPHTPIRLTYDDLVHNLAYVKKQRSYVRSAPAELDRRLSEVGRLVESLGTYQAAMEQGRLAIDPDSQERFFEDINGWLHEILDQIDEQPMDLSKISLSPALKPEQPHDAFFKAIFDAQNAARAKRGEQPLIWDPGLAAGAAAWAAQEAAMRREEHSPREGRGIARENLQEGLVGWGPLRFVYDWLTEEQHFHPGNFPDVCDGAWTQCAHYTQIIWPTTVGVGCGSATAGEFVWLVCRYSPGGNKDGKPVGYPVARAAASPPADTHAAVEDITRADLNQAGRPVELQLMDAVDALEEQINAEQARLAARDTDFAFCFPEDKQRGEEFVHKADALVESLTRAAEQASPTRSAVNRVNIEAAKKVAAEAHKFLHGLSARWPSGCNK